MYACKLYPVLQAARQLELKAQMEPAHENEA